MTSKHWWLPDLRKMNKQQLLQKAQDEFDREIKKAREYSDEDRIGGPNESWARDAVSRAKSARGMAVGVCATMEKVEKPDKYKYSNYVGDEVMKTRKKAFEGDEEALEKVMKGETGFEDDRPEEMKGYHDPCDSQVADMETTLMKTEDRLDNLV